MAVVDLNDSMIEILLTCDMFARSLATSVWSIRRLLVWKGKALWKSLGTTLRMLASMRAAGPMRAVVSPAPS
eukprot:COSAG05_NODE_10383_length_568_cov_1.153518_1_plen_72_part_00